MNCQLCHIYTRLPWNSLLHNCRSTCPQLPFQIFTRFIRNWEFTIVNSHFLNIRGQTFAVWSKATERPTKAQKKAGETWKETTKRKQKVRPNVRLIRQLKRVILLPNISVRQKKGLSQVCCSKFFYLGWMPEKKRQNNYLNLKRSNIFHVGKLRF